MIVSKFEDGWVHNIIIYMNLQHVSVNIWKVMKWSLSFCHTLSDENSDFNTQAWKSDTAHEALISGGCYTVNPEGDW